MAKVDTIDLRKTIGREEFDFLLLADALSPYSGVRQKINQLLKSESIIGVKKGLYVFGTRLRQGPICREMMANLIYGPSCISLEYALAYHGFIPERVDTITSVTSKKNNEFNTAIGRFTYRHLRARMYTHGIDLVWIDKQHPVLIATPEKALCDYVVLNDVQEFENAKAARDFLEFDLRIDRENWERLNVKKLIGLNKFYKSQVIASLMEIL